MMEQIFRLVNQELTHFREKTNENEPKPTYESLLQKLPDAKIHAMMEVICAEHFFPAHFFVKHPDAKKVINMFTLGVHRNYRKHGIGGHLVDQTFKVKCDPKFLYIHLVT